MKVILFKFSEVAEIDLSPTELTQMIGSWTLFSINNEFLVKTAQAQTPEKDYFLLVRPIVEIPDKLEGEQAIEEEMMAAREADAGWIDRRDRPLQVIWRTL